jgi:hypothetical protein
MTHSSTDYCGTGRSFSELNAMPTRERNALLARMLFSIDHQLEPLVEQRKQVANWLQQDMFAAGADVIDTGDLLVQRSVTRKWEYDAEGLTQLLGFITQEQYERAVQPTVKVNKNELNKLKKLGKNVTEIIDQNCRLHITSEKITVVRQKLSVRPEPRVYAPADPFDEADPLDEDE